MPVQRRPSAPMASSPEPAGRNQRSSILSIDRAAGVLKALTSGPRRLGIPSLPIASVWLNPPCMVCSERPSESVSRVAGHGLGPASGRCCRLLTGGQRATTRCKTCPPAILDCASGHGHAGHAGPLRHRCPPFRVGGPGVWPRKSPRLTASRAGPVCRWVGRSTEHTWTLVRSGWLLGA